MAVRNIPENNGWHFYLDGPSAGEYSPIQYEGKPVPDLEIITVDGLARYVRAPRADTLGIFAYKFDGLLDTSTS